MRMGFNDFNIQIEILQFETCPSGLPWFIKTKQNKTKQKQQTKTKTNNAIVYITVTVLASVCQIKETIN